MLKIALPTFKNDENHTQNSKIHIQNSGYEVRCGENAVVVSCILVAKVAKWWCDCGMFCRGCGGFNVFFRRLQGLFAVKMRCKNGKIWCENGEIVVYFRRVHA